MFNIYYSRSNDVSDAAIGPTLQNFFQNIPLPSEQKQLLRHERGGNYDPAKLDSADVVVVGMKKDDSTIGKGCIDEIERAFKAEIPVFVISYFKDVEDWGMQRLNKADFTKIEKSPQVWADLLLFDVKYEIGSSEKQVMVFEPTISSDIEKAFREADGRNTLASYNPDEVQTEVENWKDHGSKQTTGSEFNENTDCIVTVNRSLDSAFIDDDNDDTIIQITDSDSTNT